MVPGTGSRHLVPKRVVAGIRLPDDPPMPTLWVGIGNSQPSPFGLASEVILPVLPMVEQVLPFFHGDQTFSVVGR
jgi:hypothetical protein